MKTKRTVVIVATLDTKGEAAAYLRDEIASWGLDTILIDPGVLGTPTVKPDITREEVAQAAGTTLQALIAQGKKGICIAKQTEGLCNIVRRLWEEGRLDGIVAIGGGQGTSIGTAAMRVLPVGVPKLMLSTIASGLFRFGPYVGTKDICMMHSVTDILDVNAISRPILRNAANAIAGMALRHPAPAQHEKPVIAVTQLGITTPCVMRVKAILETKGYQIVPFHANGSGGPAMEDLIEAGKFAGVIDLSVHEVIDGIYDGLAGAQNRMDALTRYAIPAVVSVGGGDYLLWESVDKAPPAYRDRPKMVHNAQMTVFQPSPEEMATAARAMIDRLNRALGPTLVIIPTVGFSDMNQPGRELYNPEGNEAVIREFQTGLRPEVPLVLIPAHINDPIFADAVADCMARLLDGEKPAEVAARYGNGG
ncbi:MAG: Tm-1-like ATP-binding domain-containing protein [Chloroflexi bacterium]|nr:Tm-1-like ATP-binding domain-containing protein [Chloroflexota bacterium]